MRMCAGVRVLAGAEAWGSPAAVAPFLADDSCHGVGMKSVWHVPGCVSPVFVHEPFEGRPLSQPQCL